MLDEFFLPVHFEGKDLELPARLLNYGYSVKMEIEIDGDIVIFEPDEERNWRATIPYEKLETTKKMNVELLKAIALEIETLTK